MNVEELLSLVGASIFQDEPTFLEGFHDAVDTAVFAPDGAANPAATQFSEERTLYACVDDRFWRTSVPKSPKLC